MIIRQKFEGVGSFDARRSVLKDTGWSDVAYLVHEMNIYMESFNVLCTEGPPYRMQGGMRDIGIHFGGWGFGHHEDSADEPSVDLMHEDSGAESESNGADRSNSLAAENGCPSSDSVIPSVVSVTVGLPRRFGNPVCSDEDQDSQVTADLGTSPELQVTADLGTSPELQATPDLGTSPECTIKSSLRELLRKVTVNESALRTAIESLGGGVKGLKAVVDYVKYFQATRESNAGDPNPDAFTRGLEQFCLQYGQAKEGSVLTASRNMYLNPAVPGTNEPETQRINGASMDQNRQTLPSLQIRGQEWSSNAHAGDPYTMGYMENMGGYFPNFCYPFPPPFASYGPFNMGVRPMYVPMMGVPYFTPPSREYMRTDAITRASRKSRIARRRVHGNDQHHPRSMAKPAHVGGGIVQSGRQENVAHQKLAVTSFGQGMQGMQGLSTGDLMFLLQKQLSPSGVSSLGRIVLPKKEAETHLPHLVASEGVLLNMADFDTGQRWTFRYRFWSNNKSRMYLLENTRDFVKAHNLQERDMLVLYRDAEGNYVVRGEKSGTNQACDAAGDTGAEEVTPTEEEFPVKKQKF